MPALFWTIALILLSPSVFAVGITEDGEILILPPLLKTEECTGNLTSVSESPQPATSDSDELTEPEGVGLAPFAQGDATETPLAAEVTRLRMQLKGEQDQRALMEVQIEENRRQGLRANAMARAALRSADIDACGGAEPETWGFSREETERRIGRPIPTWNEDLEWRQGVKIRQLWNSVCRRRSSSDW